MPETDAPIWLSAEDLVKRWGGLVGLKTLERWRSGRDNVGPHFIRLYAGGPVRYRLEDVIAFEEQSRFLTNHEERERRKARRASRGK